MPPIENGLVRRGRFIRALLPVGAALLAACGDEVIDPPFRDSVRPRVTLARGNFVADSVLTVNVTATDNMGLKRIRLLLSGSFSASYDTVMTSAVTTLGLTVTVRVPPAAPIGGTVNALAVASDGAGNLSDTATVALTVGNLQPPLAAITSPVAGSPVVLGKSLVVGLVGRARYKVAMLGYVLSGAITRRDSVTFRSPYRDSVAIIDTIVVPDTVTGKLLTLTPFVMDSLGQRVSGTAASFAVQPLTSVGTVPVVSTTVSSRLEVLDSLSVTATDPVGITTLGYEIRTPAGQLLAVDSLAATGGFSTLSRAFRVRLPVTTFPTSVLVTGFARNANGRREVARTAAGAIRSDTAVVVAGFTSALPAGGVVADAVYMPRTDRLYLTNIERNWLEVFSLADSSFKAPIAVGSRPWGLAPWPRNRAGEVGDTLLVANSGGTNLSYVDLTQGPTGREVFRYALPNLIVYGISSTTSETTGEVITQRTVYDFSDRPQYLATTCTGGLEPTAPCQQVMAVYSTTPTPGQSGGFAGKGTLRWENLSSRMSHFFFEHATGQSQDRSDTLEIVRFAANGVGSDSVLVPAKQGVPRPDGTVDSVSVVVRLGDLAFRDTTYVRNSGNFRRAVFGEGGPVLGSRMVMYDATAGLDPSLPLPVVDRGISRSIDASDFIANTFARVAGVAINFDGELSALKSDSTYLLDRLLRLQGILQSRAGMGGLDFHPLNRGANSAPLTTRLAFVASLESSIDVFDTYCYRKVTAIPIRDPIIGPVRSSLRANGQLVLTGATARGVVTVALPDAFTTSCQ